ncbi:MAG: 30S ribosomal protein S24e [Methanosarcinaceae archaeon]
MDITVTEDKNNALLDRREINFKVKYEGATPSRNDVRNQLLAMLDASLDLTIIQKLDNEYGMQELTGYAKIYEDATRMVQIERKHMVKRNEVSAKPEAEVSEDTETEEAPAAEVETEANVEITEEQV